MNPEIQKELETLKIELDAAQARYNLAARFAGMDKPTPQNFPDGWDTEWQPSFDAASLRDELQRAALSKPIRKFQQIDVFQNEGGGDDVMKPDEDGDCIFFSGTYELHNSHCLRVLIPSGATKVDTIRGLKKAIETVRKSPDVCSWNWGYIEVGSSGWKKVIEPVIGVKNGDNAKVNPIVETMKGLSQNELDALIKAAQNIAQEKELNLPF